MKYSPSLLPFITISPEARAMNVASHRCEKNRVQKLGHSGHFLEMHSMFRHNKRRVLHSVTRAT
jgi:hypothetical protein